MHDCCEVRAWWIGVHSDNLSTLEALETAKGIRHFLCISILWLKFCGAWVKNIQIEPKLYPTIACVLRQVQTVAAVKMQHFWASNKNLQCTKIRCLCLLSPVFLSVPICLMLWQLFVHFPLSCIHAHPWYPTHTSPSCTKMNAFTLVWPIQFLRLLVWLIYILVCWTQGTLCSGFTSHCPPSCFPPPGPGSRGCYRNKLHATTLISHFIVVGVKVIS